MKQTTNPMYAFAIRSVPAIGIAGALLLAGCSTDGSRSGSTSTTSASSASPTSGSTSSISESSTPTDSILPPTSTPSSSAPSASASAAVAGETIDWEPCGEIECGTVTVPIDRNDESLGTLEIAINVRRATNPDERIGYLLVNPGGPGGSGLGLAEFAVPIFGEDVTDRFDVIGFDPRGVGQSEPTFECGAGGEQRDLLKDLTFPLDNTETSAGERAAQLCTESMGPVATRLGSSFVADDMDAIRVALGADKINFLGFSYGSTLGTWYASQYPTNVRAMVLDGAAEVVSDDSTQQTRIEGEVAQARGFEEQLTEALAACDTEDCPIYNDGDPTAAYYEAIENQGLVTAETDDPDTTIEGVVSFLYSEDEWPLLWQAIADLRDGDPAAIVESAKFQQPDDGASFPATVNCLDSWAIHPTDDRATQLDDSEAFDTTLTKQFPLLGAIDHIPVEVCPFFDVLDPPAAPVTLDGGDVPVLVIGNRSDPATPFSNSERLATEVLSNGYLIETDHYKHTVFPENDCVNDHVYALLFDEQLPEAHTVTCERQDPEVLPPLEALAADCADVIAMLNPQPTAEQGEEICKRTIETVTAGKTDAELEELANPTNDETVNELSTAFDEAADAVMGS